MDDVNSIPLVFQLNHDRNEGDYQLKKHKKDPYE